MTKNISVNIFKTNMNGFLLQTYQQDMFYHGEDVRQRQPI